MNESLALEDELKKQTDDDQANIATAESAKSPDRCRGRIRKIPIVTTPSRANSSGASSSDDDNAHGSDDDDDDEATLNDSNRKTKMPSYHNSQGTPIRDSGSTSDNPTSPNAASGAAVSADQERQILLLMLLAQVCALHDPTPRTFTVHVLELFERGILGRQSIHFLFELGLVPSSTPRLLPPATTALNDSKQEFLDLTTVPSTAAPSSPQTLRAQEASAIRIQLEQHDLTQQQQDPQNATTNFVHVHDNHQSALVASTTKESNALRSSWAVEHHPLSLSRYQREFLQIRLLNAGSFGEVFHATSKTDLQDYAIKRVAFSAWNYSKDEIGQAIREVHCLAQCNHPNVVKYYTSWLEPSWMTGASAGEVRQQQKLLTDIQHMMEFGSEDRSSSDNPFTPSVSAAGNDHFQDFFDDNPLTPKNRKFSIGSSLESFGSGESSYDETSSSEEEDCSTWSAEVYDATTSRGDSIFFASSNPQREAWELQQGRARASKAKKKAVATSDSVKYRYQICLFVQMQLCHPATLGDWIRARNSQCPNPDRGRRERVETAMRIFSEILSGLCHIHKKNIVHRDLKPHNLFQSLEDDRVFLIGDFGLSKVIHLATHQQSTNKKGRSPVFSSPTAAGNSEIVHHQAPIELTEGVGTASYAAPEQVTTRTYGKRADIFSLGLILLEMMCCFTTEHERLQTFYDCRHRQVIPEWISQEYPMAAKAILDCTNPSPALRPTADTLLTIDLLRSSPASAVRESSDDVTELKQELERKNEQLRAYEQALKAKDIEISKLRKELAKSKSDQKERKAAIGPPSSACLPGNGVECADDLNAAEVQSSSSSSEDGV